MNFNFKIILKYFMWILLILLSFILILAIYFFVGWPKQAKDIVWGVNFSQKQSEQLGLDWKANYLALLEDMKVKNFKLVAYWDKIEPQNDKYNFDDLDWQIKKAEENDAKVLLVVGMKVPRWPECHSPDWNKKLNKDDQQKEVLEVVEEIINRYKNSKAIWAWQVENEPFFAFGECSWIDKRFLKKEINLVKSIDFKKRPVILSDTGEWSFWLDVANLGDIVGITMYQKVWLHQFNNYVSYPFPPIFYERKAKIINKIFGKEVIVVELQTEPWGEKFFSKNNLKEQEKSMDLIQMKENINFAKKTGFNQFYLWGSEWWYWMKEKQNHPEYWQEIKKLFQ